MTSRSRIALALAWPAALVALLYAAIGRLGFNPTDDGSLLAQSYRILAGQLPHRDFITQRPAGTPLLHTLNFALPGPLYENARVTTLAEVVAYTVLFGVLTLDAPPWRWGVPRSLLVAGAALVNLHTFPLLTWHTIDGLLLVSAGMVLITHGWDRLPLFAAGFVLLGCAAMVKQSFAPALLLGGAYTLLRAGAGGREALLSRAVIGIAAGAAAPLAYLAWIVNGHAVHPMLHQLLGARRITGLETLQVLLSTPDGVRTTLAPAALLLVGGMGVAALRRSRRAEPAKDYLLLLLRLLISAVLLWIVLWAHLGLYGTWALQATIAGAAILAADVVFWRRRLVWAAAVLLACAWMVSLSWGYSVPNLIAGSVVAAALISIWQGETEQPAASGWVIRAVPAAAAFAGAALVTYVFLGAWWSGPLYREPAAAQLTAGLGSVAPAFGSIRADPVTAEYLTDLRACVDAHPARWVAIIPDNAGLYPALELHNPLPADWLWPDETVGSTQLVLAAGRRLDQTGHFLVLDQIFSGDQLSTFGSLPTATPQTQPFSYGDGVTARIFAGLHGSRFTCGPFIGVYRP